MFGRDPILPLNTLLGPKIRYLGNGINVLSLEGMKNMFEIAATNLKLAQERGDAKDNPFSTLQPGDTVLVQNHIKGPFDPKYIGDYRVVSLKGNQVELQPANGGLTEIKHIKHVKYILPADRYIKQLPNYSVFGRKTTLRMSPDHIPDLHWNFVDTYNTKNIGHADTQDTVVSAHYIDVETLSQARGDRCGDWCGTTLNTNTSTLQSNQEITVCSIIPIN